MAAVTTVAAVAAARSAVTTARGVRLGVARAVGVRTAGNGIVRMVRVQRIQYMPKRIMRVVRRMAERVVLQRIAGMMQGVAEKMAVTAALGHECTVAGIGIGQGIFLASVHESKQSEGSKKKDVLHVW